MAVLSSEEVEAAGLTGWVHLRDVLRTRLLLPDWATGLRLVARIGAEAERVDHHPDLDLRYRHLDVSLTSWDSGGVTARDLRLARAVDALAAEEGARAVPRRAVLLELGLDTPDAERVLPFWRAVLDAERTAPDELRRADLPSLWFQPSGDEEPRQRWHPDVWVAPEEVQPRLDAAVAAGGVLVSDAEAPAFWVLADPEGNRVCLCTTRSR